MQGEYLSAVSIYHQLKSRTLPKVHLGFFWNMNWGDILGFWAQRPKLRLRKPKTQIYRDPKTQRPRNPLTQLETQRLRGPEPQKPNNPLAQKSEQINSFNAFLLTNACFAFNYCTSMTGFDNDDFSVSEGILGKKISTSPNRSRTYDLLVTTPDALPLSHERLVSS